MCFLGVVKAFLSQAIIGTERKEEEKIEQTSH